MPSIVWSRQQYAAAAVPACPPGAASCDDVAQGDAGSSSAPGGAACEGDIDRDGRVDVADVLLLLAAFGTAEACGPPALPEDLDGDCVVAVADILIALSGFGRAC